MRARHLRHIANRAKKGAERILIVFASLTLLYSAMAPERATERAAAGKRAKSSAGRQRCSAPASPRMGVSSAPAPETQASNRTLA